jgi:ABC-type glycerol-3-phosphate transport system substrate-binding protein
VAPTGITIVWFEHLSTEWGNTWFDKVTKDFLAKTGIKVERVSAPWDQLWPMMTTYMQSNTMPDVFGTYAGWNLALEKDGALADLGPLVPQLPDPEKYKADQGVMYPNIDMVNGKQELAVWWLQAYGLFYNKEAFAQHGYQLPKTWDDLTALLTKMKSDGVNGMGMSWGNPNEAGAHFGYLQWKWWELGAGADTSDAMGNPTFNNPTGLAGMDYFYNLFKQGLISQSSGSTNVQQNRGDFCAGKTMMIIDGPWMGSTCKSLGGTFTVAMAPGLCGAKTCGNVVYPWYFTVANDSKHKLEALKFIDYLTSDAVSEDFSKTFAISLANPIRSKDADYQNDPITGQIPALLAAKGNSYLPMVLNGDDIQTMLGTEWQKVIFGQETTSQAIVNMETQWKAISSK